MIGAELRRGAIRAGLIGGVASVYLGVVGLVEKLQAIELVGSAVTAGRLLLVLPALVVGYVVTRPHVQRGEVTKPPPAAGLLAGAIGGSLVGAVTIAALAIVHAMGQETVRGTDTALFVSVTRGLLEIMEFGSGLAGAVPIWIVGGGGVGAIGAALRLVPRAPSRAVTVGLVATLALALLQRIVPPAMQELGLASSWLYSPVTGGLTVGGAVIVFAAGTGAAALWAPRRDAVRQRIRRLGTGGRRAGATVGLAAIVGILVVLPGLIGSVLTNTLGTVGIFLLLGLGLNIVVGYAGLLDLGYVAFFAVGAYFTALFTGARTVSVLGDTTQPVLVSLDFWAALPFVILVAAFVGLLIGAPVLRLRGDYLAIVTLGFGEIARVLLTSNWLREVVGGAQGLRSIPTAAGFGRDPRSIYYLVLIFVFLAIYVSKRLADSRIGRAWNAMREDEQVAEAMGISTTKYKLFAFAIGASIGCLAGALFAVKLGSLTPVSFGILVSITALSVIILGGMGSIPGVIVGSVALIGIPELLTEFEEFRLLIYGAVLIAIMILRPEGLIPNVRRTAELHEEERAQDEWFRRTGEASVDAEVAAVKGGEA